MSSFLSHHGCYVSTTSGDLCYPLPELKSCAFDLALCLEVIEHIKDQADSDPIDTFNKSGAGCLVSEMFRSLKPGGVAVCTTPNANSYAQIARIGRDGAPSFHRGHVREYTVYELCDLFESKGFVTVSRETPAGIWEPTPDLNIEAAMKYVQAIGGSSDFREEDIIAVFMKP